MLVIQSYKVNVHNHVEPFMSAGDRIPRYMHMGQSMTANLDLTLDEAGSELMQAIVQKYRGDIEAYIRDQFEQRVEEEIFIRLTKGVPA